MYTYAATLGYDKRMPDASSFSVLPSRELRTEFPKALERFRIQGIAAAPVVFGAHRKPEAVMIPFELYARLLPAIEDLEIAELVRNRTADGAVTPLAETAAKLGIDLDAL